MARSTLKGVLYGTYLATYSIGQVVDGHQVELGRDGSSCGLLIICCLDNFAPEICDANGLSNASLGTYAGWPKGNT